MGGILTRTGVEPMVKYQLIIGLAESAHQRSAAEDLLAGTEVVSVDGTIELSAEATSTATTWNVIIRDPVATERLQITVQALPADQAGQPDRDVRNPNPPPDRWNMKPDRWELFNCLVIGVAFV